MRIFKPALLVAAMSIGTLAASVTQASTLEEVKQRGELNCIVSTGVAGLGLQNEDGRWEGFEIDFCRAMAAAVLGDGEKVKFVPTTPKTRFSVLNSGEGDVLFRSTTETLSRDVDIGLTFLPIMFYDGQAFMVREELGVSSTLELDGASICVSTGTTTELTLADYFKKHEMQYEPIPVSSSSEGLKAYLSNRCDAYTIDSIGLAIAKYGMENPQEHVILPEVISKEPYSGAVRQGDDQWADIGKWVVNAIIAAEELGITQENVEQLAAEAGENANVNRLLGTEGNIGEMLGLEKDWAVNVIKTMGNYGESFDRYIKPLGLERALNAQWTEGGLLYAPPIR